MKADQEQAIDTDDIKVRVKKVRTDNACQAEGCEHVAETVQRLRHHYKKNHPEMDKMTGKPFKNLTGEPLENLTGEPMENLIANDEVLLIK